MTEPAAFVRVASVDPDLTDAATSPAPLRRVDAAASLAALDRYLATNLADASVARAAKELRVSSRTLQRVLGNAGTSFVRELTRARIREAVALLEHTNAKIATVARRVGLASVSHFRARFLAERGLLPAAYRKLHREEATAPRALEPAAEDVHTPCLAGPPSGGPGRRSTNREHEP